MQFNGRKRLPRASPPKIPNWCQNVPTSPKMMAKGKRKAFCIMLNRFGEPLRHHFRQQVLWNADQHFWKSMLEKYQLIIAISLKIHAEMMIQADEKARCYLRFLWLRIFVILPHRVGRKRSTVLWKIDVRLPVVNKNENKMGNDAIGGPKSDQTAVGDAIRKTAQETK